MSLQTATSNSCEAALHKLLAYCRGEGWAGYDPYDGLNSPVAHTFLLKQRLTRTVLTQVVKRSPVNLRPLIGIKKELNPKGVALAARAVMLLADRYGVHLPSSLAADTDTGGGVKDDGGEGLLGDFNSLMSALVRLRSEGYSEACWGYNFDWQSRAFFAPRGTPNVVCTVFAAHAFLDWHERTASPEALDMAESSCRFLLDRINRSESAGGFCFSYTPVDRSRVHNVNLLAAELLARLFTKNHNADYREAAERATAYTLSRQRDDGSWPYGESDSQQWVDSFHTGFLIVSLKHLIDWLGAERWSDHLKRAYDFYEERFFLADCTPRYYHDKLYPVDVHSAAQAVVTFREMADLIPDAERMAARAVTWAIDNLQDAAGYFYFQRHRFYTIKTSFMRWSQSWMLYALSLYLSKDAVSKNV
jgi:hypothetical protein